MRLHNPEYLFFLLIWIPMIWIYVRRSRRSAAAIRFSDLSILKKIRPGAMARLRHLPFVLRLAGLALLAVALARPQMGQTEEEVATDGVDIVLVLDVSTSMKALDFQPKNRLFVAKETMKDFITKRQHDRLGLVVFSARAYTKCPLTLDYSILTQFIDEIQFGQIEDGTAIGTAIATAANRLKDSRAKSRVIILATDGANNRGEIAPLTAAEAAGKMGIKIYTIGVGKDGMIPYPVEMVNPFTGQPAGTQVQMMESDLDEASLQSIAEATKGQFFRARDSEGLKLIYEKIDKLEKTEIKSRTYTTYSEKFFPWLLFGAAILFLELTLANTRFRRIP